MGWSSNAKTAMFSLRIHLSCHHLEENIRFRRLNQAQIRFYQIQTVILLTMAGVQNVSHSTVNARFSPKSIITKWLVNYTERLCLSVQLNNTLLRFRTREDCLTSHFYVPRVTSWNVSAKKTKFGRKKQPNKLILQRCKTNSLNKLLKQCMKNSKIKIRSNRPQL